MKIPLGEIIQTIDKTGQTGGGIISTVNWIISLLRRMTQTGVEPVPTDGEMKLPTSEIILTKDSMHEKERELIKLGGKTASPEGKGIRHL